MIRLVAMGMPRKAIARHMRLSEKTIDWHLNQAGERIGVRDIAGFTRYAIMKKLIPLRLKFTLALVNLALIGAAQAAPLSNLTNRTWSVWFDYPTNYMARIQSVTSTTPGIQTNAAAMAQLTNVTYRIYLAGSLAGSNTVWSLVTTTNNPPAAPDGKTIAFSVPTMPVQQLFFTASISNSFGEFFFINPAVVALLPPDPSYSYTLQASP